MLEGKINIEGRLTGKKGNVSIKLVEGSGQKPILLSGNRGWFKWY